MYCRGLIFLFLAVPDFFLKNRNKFRCKMKTKTSSWTDSQENYHFTQSRAGIVLEMLSLLF